MSAVDHLRAHGVRVVRSPGGGFKLAGLGSLPPEEARRIVDYAKANRAAILAEVGAGEPDVRDTPTRTGEHPSERYARGCPRYWAACFQCPDADLGSLYFCKRLRTPDGGWLQ